MNCEFKEIIAFKDFSIENGVLRLEWDMYLSIVKFNIKKSKYFLFFICVFCSTLALVKNHTNEWNTFTSWFIDWKVLLLFIVVIFYFIIYLLTFIFYSEVVFIKSLDDVKSNEKQSHSPKMDMVIQYSLTKMIKSGIMRMFIKSDEKQSHSPKINILLQYSLTKWLTQG
jgi:hypothetical protein